MSQYVRVFIVYSTFLFCFKSDGASSADHALPHGFDGDFLHGVASGEPRADAIVLWTRFTPRNASTRQNFRVRWEVLQETLGGSATISTGVALAKWQHDFTIKIDVNDGSLVSGVWYTFRFERGPASSPWGHFRLPPKTGSPLAKLRYAIFSCSNWAWGSFAAYRAAADMHKETPLDFWLHLGDFYYEYGDGYPSMEQKARGGLDPIHDLVTLEDYRRRHALYRTDPDLQTLSASAPIIAIWDDHEVANDSWMDGAQNHQPNSEGSYFIRKVAAVRAYHEWMPTRLYAVPVQGESMDMEINASMPVNLSWKVWRRFDFGDLAMLLMLETRLWARTTQAELTWSMVADRISKFLSDAGDPDPLRWPGSDFELHMRRLHTVVENHRRSGAKRLLGDEQLHWISQQMAESQNLRSPGVAPRWRLVGQPQVMQEMMPPHYEAAIQQEQSVGSDLVARRWAQIFWNTTAIGSTLRFNKSQPYASKMLGSSVVVTPQFRRQMLVSIAAGTYKINLNFDAWAGYVAERERLTDALRVEEFSPHQGSVVVYGGDSHNAWAGLLRTRGGEVVAADFDGMSVTSPGVENYMPLLPADFEAAAWRAANPDMVWADTYNRGFMLVSLDHSEHVVEYFGVGTNPYTTERAKCLQAFSMNLPMQQELIRHRACVGDVELMVDPAPDPSDLQVMIPVLVAIAAGVAGIFLGCLFSKLVRSQCSRVKYRRFNAESELPSSVPADPLGNSF